jgi:hypothetical protein
MSETFKFHAGNSIFVPKHYGNTGVLNPPTPSVVNFGNKNPRDFIYNESISSIRERNMKLLSRNLRWNSAEFQNLHW